MSQHKPKEIPPPPAPPKPRIVQMGFKFPFVPVANKVPDADRS
jgi:hypothetical protein